jgi:two-component system sensor histidine kinase UhpB
MLGTIQDITERKKAGLELEKSQKELKKLTAHLHTVREEERTLVAHELHDDIGQALTALKIDMYMLEKKLPKDKKDISDQIKATKDLLDKTIQTTRKMYSQLRPTLIEHFSIKEVLEDQFETFKISNNISGGTDIDLEGTTLKEEEAITIYRIVQEALNNVKWHSQANTVNIGLKKLENHFKLTIEDDGIGIKDKDLNKSKSFGIIGMKERTSFLGGEIEFTGTPNKGTTITVTFPLNPENG